MKKLLLLSLLFIGSSLISRSLNFINKTGKPVDILVQVPGVTHNASIVGEQPFADSIRYSLNSSDLKQSVNIPEQSVKNVFRNGEYIQRNMQWPISFSAEMVTDKMEKVTNAICPTTPTSILEKPAYTKCYDLIVKTHADSEKVPMPAEQDMNKLFMIGYDTRHNKLMIKSQAIKACTSPDMMAEPTMA